MRKKQKNSKDPPMLTLTLTLNGTDFKAFMGFYSFYGFYGEGKIKEIVKKVWVHVSYMMYWEGSISDGVDGSLILHYVSLVLQWSGLTLIIIVQGAMPGLEARYGEH